MVEKMLSKLIYLFLMAKNKLDNSNKNNSNQNHSDIKEIDASWLLIVAVLVSVWLISRVDLMSPYEAIMDWGNKLMVEYLSN